MPRPCTRTTRQKRQMLFLLAVQQAARQRQTTTIRQKRIMMPKYPCLTCGDPTTQPPYCSTHRTIKQRKPQSHSRLYNNQYRKAARVIRENATHCWICKGQPTVSDPIQADHVTTGDPTSILLPIHRSCNTRRQERNQSTS